MKYISAPWRAEYVKSVFKMSGCIFCEALKNGDDKESFILYRGKSNFIMLNKYPYSPGHMMIAPYLHLDSPEKSDKEVSDEMSDLMKRSIEILRKKYKPQGFNMGMNIGRSAGAGVDSHYHLHIVPRWTGDSNFMPLIGKTRVVIEDLNETYDTLLPLFMKGFKE